MNLQNFLYPEPDVIKKNKLKFTHVILSEAKPILFRILFFFFLSNKIKNITNINETLHNNKSFYFLIKTVYFLFKK